MSALAQTLLAAASSYAASRMQQFVSPEAMQNAVGGVLPADPAGLQAHLDAAADHAARGEVWPGLLRLREAARELGADDDRFVDAVHRAIAAAGPGGLIGLLGFPAPLRPTFSGAGLTIIWRTASPVCPIPGASLERAEVRCSLAAAGLSMALVAGGLRIDLGSGADPVLASLIGASARVSTDLRLSVSAAGLRSDGSVGPIALPGSIVTSVAELDGMELRLARDGADLVPELRARLRGELGPASATVDGIGVRLHLDAAALLGGPGQPVRLEPALDIDGIGIAIDAGVVSGGGYLQRKARAGGTQYGGVLQLRLGPVDAKAFGLFVAASGDTAFVAVVSAEFEPAIELGLGFTLNGVGGIVGHGVTIDTAALAAGLQDGTLARLLFPADPVAAAPQILDTLESVFPLRRDGFVIGPMLALGWGRPTLVRLDLAVALALPSPVVVVLGRAHAAFPTEQAPAIELNASLLAQFGGGMVLVRAELEESRVGFATVQGGFGLLARFSDQPTFVVSAGGFHPRFTRVPPELAGLPRISSQISPPVGLQLRLSGYVALTPNTLQLGGSVEIAYSVLVAAVRGSLSIDALVEFDPFGFDVVLLAKVQVEALGHSLVGVDLALRLQGPTPWIAEGKGRVRLPWPLPDPSISVGPIRWGEDPPEPPPPSIDALGAAKAALQDPLAWGRVDRPGASVPVVMAALEPQEPGTVVLDPWSLIRCSQRRVPLGMQLDRIGRSPVRPGPASVRIDAAPRLGGRTVDRVSPVTEAFATAQYVDLPEDQALTAPSFEQRVSGAVIDPAELAATAPARVEARLQYEDCWPGEPFVDPGRILRRHALFTFDLASAASALDRTAAATARAAAARYAEPRRPLTPRPPSAVRVADARTFATTAQVDSLAADGSGMSLWTDALVAAHGAGRRGTALTKQAAI
jgi:hypothetical protein